MSTALATYIVPGFGKAAVGSALAGAAVGFYLSRAQPKQSDVQPRALFVSSYLLSFALCAGIYAAYHVPSSAVSR
jgi:hypothetical protein